MAAERTSTPASQYEASRTRSQSLGIICPPASQSGTSRYKKAKATEVAAVCFIQKAVAAATPLKTMRPADCLLFPSTARKTDKAIGRSINISVEEVNPWMAG